MAFSCKCASKVAMATPGVVYDTIPEFEITLQTTYDLYKRINCRCRNRI